MTCARFTEILRNLTEISMPKNMKILQISPCKLETKNISIKIRTKIDAGIIINYIRRIFVTKLVQVSKSRHVLYVHIVYNIMFGILCTCIKFDDSFRNVSTYSFHVKALTCMKCIPCCQILQTYDNLQQDKTYKQSQRNLEI